MSTWTPQELGRIAAAEELALSARRADGTLRDPVRIWVVRVGDELYVRSYRGPNGAWYRAARSRPHGRVSAGGVEREVEFAAITGQINDSVDAAYQSKYARYPSYVSPLLSEVVRQTTLRLVPEGAEP